MNPLSRDGEKVLKLFKKRKQKIFVTTATGALITFVALAIVGIQLLYPYHTVIGIGLWCFSFLPFIRSLYLSRKSFSQFKTYDFAQSFLKRQRVKIYVVVGFMIGAIVFITVRPIGQDPFMDLRGDALRERIAEDMFQATAAMDYLETTGNVLLDALNTEARDANTAEHIKDTFNDFIIAVLFSESLTETHRYFDQIPYRYGKERDASFLISYSLYVKKYELLHRMMLRVDNDEFKRKVLNENVAVVNESGVYSEMVERYFALKTRIRITAGKLYQMTFGNTPNDSYDGAYGLLETKVNGSYAYLFTHFGETVAQTGSVATEAVRSRMFEQWFPIQKTVANTMGHIILSERGNEGLIENPDIALMREHMRPGDIMLQRRNWHLSNVGIPGFWTHAALFTGTLAEMDAYFASEFPRDGYTSMSAYIEGVYPLAYEKYGTDASTSVIEAIEPGVVVRTLEKSADADFVVVLRPNLLKEDVLRAILRAMRHVGKPYDYNFDFDTKDALVCSELVYDAYYEVPGEKKGLHFDTSMVSGRTVVSPLDMAKEYRDEYGGDETELSFVYFITTDEKTGKVTPGTEVTFLESVDWNKFTFAQ